MTSVAELVTDLSDTDLAILTRLTARLALPAEPHEEASWPPRVEGFWHGMACALDEEKYRRSVMVQELRDSTGEGGVGALVSDCAAGETGLTEDELADVVAFIEDEDRPQVDVVFLEADGDVHSDDESSPFRLPEVGQ